MREGRRLFLQTLNSVTTENGPKGQALPVCGQPNDTILLGEHLTALLVQMSS